MVVWFTRCRSGATGCCCVGSSVVGLFGSCPLCAVSFSAQVLSFLAWSGRLRCYFIFAAALLAVSMVWSSPVGSPYLIGIADLRHCEEVVYVR